MMIIILQKYRDANVSKQGTSENDFPVKLSPEKGSIRGVTCVVTIGTDCSLK